MVKMASDGGEAMNERQPKKVYWGVVNDLGELEVVTSRKEAVDIATWWTSPALYVSDFYVHVVRLVPEVVKTMRRKS